MIFQNFFGGNNSYKKKKKGKKKKKVEVKDTVKVIINPLRYPCRPKILCIK